MEDLNNRQIVLLTMFTSFVISVATGIITVAMLQVAPETLTQTVNRVVEHTIERVVTGTTTPEQPQSIVTNNVTKEVTVYAKEDDLLVSAVEKNQPRVAVIYGNGTSSDPIGIGFVASRDGLVVSDAKSLLGDAPPRDSYTVVIRGVSHNAIPVTGQDPEKPIFFLKVTGITASSTLDAMTYGRGDPKIAQTVVILGGSDGSGVLKASLSKIRYAKSNSTTTPAQITGIETTPRAPNENLGGPVINLDGQLVGVIIGDPIDAARSLVYPISRILGGVRQRRGRREHNQSPLAIGLPSLLRDLRVAGPIPR